MKKFTTQSLSLLIGIFATLGFSSCEKDKEDAKLEVDTSELTLGADGDSRTMKISSNTSWQITGFSGWVNVSPVSSSGNKSVVISATENSTTTPRSCTLNISTENGKISETVRLTQEGRAASISVDVSQLSLAGNATASGSFRITSNTNWTISGAAEWLALSSTGGNGNASITATAKTPNNSSKPRECTLTITADNASVNVIVSQNGMASSNCNVTPNTIVTLADGLAFDYNYDANVVYYYSKLFTADYITRYTDNELIAEIRKDDDSRDTPGDDYIRSHRYLSPNTNYVICCIAYDRNGNHGDLVKTPVRTKSDRNQPDVYISNVGYNDTYWLWDTTIGSYAKGYYMCIFNQRFYTWSTPALAWMFYNWLKSDPDDFALAIQNGSWTSQRNGETKCNIMAWAIDSNNNLSGVVDHYRGEITSNICKPLNAPAKGPEAQSFKVPAERSLIRVIKR